ncbi:MAG TPA: ABC transporter permease [Longimicrobiales bacterium]|nr:ABC transporter permease [Longimicrobiales bacterium]
MIGDVFTMAWKEWRELLRIGGGRRGVIVRALFSVGLLGVIWPWLVGAQFVASAVPVLFAAATSAMYVSALVPDAFPGERERHTLETLLASRLPDAAILLGKVAAAVTYGYTAALLMLVSGWITVNVKVSAPPFLLYRSNVLIGAVGFSLLSAALMAGLGTVISLRAATVKQAQQVLTTGVMLLLLTPAILAEAWPRGWSWLIERVSATDRPPNPASTALIVAAVMLAATVLLLLIALRRFRRSTLVLEKP